SRMVSARAIQERYPSIKREGLRGGVEYSDGEFNDSRMNVALATTAAAHGAAVANHVEVTGLLKEGGQVCGVQVRDRFSGESWPIRAKVVVNATGPFIDGIRELDDPDSQSLVVPSAGTHIVVNRELDIPEQHGLLIPKAPNGSVAFIKPFEGGVLVGTTEEATEITEHPSTTEEQVSYLIDVANHYLEPDRQVTRDDVGAVWTGIRPLVRDPNDADKNTSSLSRDHIIETSKSGLVTIGGGKWTTFAKMGRDVIDAASERAELSEKTPDAPTRVIGAHGYRDDLPELLESHFNLSPDIASHLAVNYGDRATDVLALPCRTDSQGQRQRLHPDHPYLESEVRYAVRTEYAL
ncbi:MAG: FAD-dependent oxidoreductase, partial [Myxococcota bacterium]